MNPIKNLLACSYFFLWIAEFWTICIAFLCLVTFKKLPNIGIGGSDKMVHFTMHFVFTILWFLYFNKKTSNSKMLLLKIFSTSVVYGVLIELAQKIFTTTRNGDIYDVIANSSGAISAVLLVFIYNRFIKSVFTN